MLLYLFEDQLSHFNSILSRDRRTGRRTDRQTELLYQYRAMHNWTMLPDCLHVLLPGPFLLMYSGFCFFLVFSLFFRFCAVRYIRLAISSAFERTLFYRTVSYHMLTNDKKTFKS